MNRRELLKYSVAAAAAFSVGGPRSALAVPGAPGRIERFPFIESGPVGPEPSYKPETYGEDLAILLTRLGSPINPDNITVNLQFRQPIGDLMRRLHLKAFLRSITAYVGLRQEVYGDGILQAVLRPIGRLTIETDPTVSAGANTTVLLNRAQQYEITTRFGQDSHSISLAANEALHQFGATGWVENTDFLGRPLAETYSNLLEGETLRWARTGPLPLYVNPSYEDLHDYLRFLRTNGYAPFQNTPDKLAMIRNLNNLISIFGSDLELVNLWESVGAEIAKYIFYSTNYNLAIDIFHNIMAHINNRADRGGIESTIQRLILKESLPPRDYRSGFTRGQIYQVGAVSSESPDERVGAYGDHGYYVHFLTFQAIDSGLNPLPAFVDDSGNSITITWPGGRVPVNMEKAYRARLEGSCFGGFFIPFSAIGGNHIPDGSVFGMHLRQPDGKYKDHILRYSYEGYPPDQDQVSIRQDITRFWRECPQANANAAIFPSRRPTRRVVADG